MAKLFFVSQWYTGHEGLLIEANDSDEALAKLWGDETHEPLEATWQSYGKYQSDVDEVYEVDPEDPFYKDFTRHT